MDSEEIAARIKRGGMLVNKRRKKRTPVDVTLKRRRYNQKNRSQRTIKGSKYYNVHKLEILKRSKKRRALKHNNPQVTKIAAALERLELAVLLEANALNIEKFTSYRITGNTYAFKEDIKSAGGHWDKPSTSWIVEVGGMKSIGTMRYLLQRIQKAGCKVEKL